MKRFQYLHTTGIKTAISKRGAKLQEGFYKVISAKTTKKGLTGANHDVVLQSVQFNPSSGWTNDPITVPVEMDHDDAYHFFGMKSRNARGSVGPIEQLLRDVARKVGKEKDLNPALDYDKIFRGIARNMFARAYIQIPEEDREDLLMDCLLRTITPETVSKFDPTRDPIKYFGGMLQLNLMSAIKTYTTRHMKNVKPKNDLDMTSEEFQDFLDSKTTNTPKQNVHNVVEYNILVDGIKKFLEKQRDGHYMTQLFDLSLQGYPSKEIAQKLVQPNGTVGVSPAIVSRHFVRLKEYLLEYADETGNDLLWNLVEDMATKRHASSLMPSPALASCSWYPRSVLIVRALAR